VRSRSELFGCGSCIRILWRAEKETIVGDNHVLAIWQLRDQAEGLIASLKVLTSIVAQQCVDDVQNSPE
jgi:hypothetical protein